MIVPSSFDGHNSNNNNVNGYMSGVAVVVVVAVIVILLSFYLVFAVVDDHLSIFAYRFFLLLCSAFEHN